MKRYTNFILTVIASLMMVSIFKGEIITPANAISQQHFQYVWDQNAKIIEMLESIIDILENNS